MPRPVIEGTTSAWVKTLFDPAHARDYGCVGLPDENRNPTNVISCRRDLVVSANALGSISNTVWRTNTPSDTAPTKMTNSEITTLKGTTTRVSFFLLPTNDLYIYMEGSFTYKASSGGVETATPFLWYCYPVIQAMDIPALGGRALSASITVDNVTSWSDIGGYFVGGNMPMKYVYDDDGIPDVYVTLAESQYATYTGQSAKGAYALCRPRTIDGISRFAEKQIVALAYSSAGSDVVNELSTSGGTDTQQYGFVLPYPAWDWAFVTYYPCSTQNWTIRATIYNNTEVLRDYNAGGQDGATYDRTALNFAMGLCDNAQFCFPAEYNDAKRLLPFLRKMAKHFMPQILQAMGLPQGLDNIVSPMVSFLLNDDDLWLG